MDHENYDTVKPKLALVKSDVRSAVGEKTKGRQAVARADVRYGSVNGELSRLKDGDKAIFDPLCNFMAQIVAEKTYDDGVTTTVIFEIEGTTRDGEKLPRISVAADEYAKMSWIAEHWGTRAVVYAGGKRDHLRAAIQLLSHKIVRTNVFGMTGWRAIDGHDHYVHAGGSISAGVTGAYVETDLREGRLGLFRLPKPPPGETLIRAVRASLDLLNLAPERLTAPLLAAVYRAPLGEVLPVDFALWVVGLTGLFKSELAAIVQAHFGADFNGRNLPGNWTSSAGALERATFLAKDVAFVIDDFVPKGTASQKTELHQKAERVLRGLGNCAGRATLTADRSLRRENYPRSLIISTGETLPAGQSLRARILMLEVGAGDIEAESLTRFQRLASDGVFATAMAGFTAWLAPRLPTLKDKLTARHRELRQELQGHQAHRRSPDIIANLIIGLETLLEFAEAVGAIDSQAVAIILKRCLSAFDEVAKAQIDLVQSEDESAKFLSLVAESVRQGNGHIAHFKTGGSPASLRPTATGWLTSLGWRQAKRAWAAQGAKLGWTDGKRLLLEPAAAFEAAQTMVGRRGEVLGVGDKALWKRLAERRLIQSAPGEAKNLVKVLIEAGRPRVLVLTPAGAELVVPGMGALGAKGR